MDSEAPIASGSISATEEDPVNVIAYLRVSTDRQADEGLGLEVQEEAIRKWADSAGHKLILATRDEGVSGSNGIETRLGLAEALDLMREGRAGALVVYRLDRLARDLIVQEQLLADIRKMGCQVFSTSAAEAGYLQDDPSDPSRKLIRQVLGAVSEYERAMVRLRLEAGRRRKAETGGYAGYGSPPYGYRAQEGALVEVPHEQVAIARMRELQLQARSLRAIGERLLKEGHLPRRSKTWHPDTIAQILARNVEQEALAAS